MRDVALRDAPALSKVHEGSDGPWVDPVQCAVFVNHRLLRPFLCRIALLGKHVVGHAEWIVGYEPGLPSPYLYLGMLQVRPDCRGSGAGRRLIRDGEELARLHGCDRLRTVPTDDAVGFYTRCGLRRTAASPSSVLPVGVGSMSGWRNSRSVPERAARELPMRLGWVQACSVHMWEICNRPVVLAGEPWSHPCARSEGGAGYVQLRFSGVTEALALAWASQEVPTGDLVRVAQAMAWARGLGSLILAHAPGEGNSGTEDRSEEWIAVMELPLG